MGKVWRRGVPFDAAVAPLVGRMGAVEEDREALQRLHATWDTLALLGQMSGTLAEIADTREQFQALSHVLLDALARRHLDDAAAGLRTTAQVAIDVLVRNLFERTADVGFLATDAAVRALGAGTADRAAVERRFAQYVAKYSVYDDVVVLDAGGRVLARLDRAIAADHCTEPWVADAQRPGVPFVERFGPTALRDGRPALLYAAGLADGGVLCLSFRFGDEVGRLFGGAARPDGATVVGLVDAGRRVTATSDPWQLPVGMVLPEPVPGAPLVRLAGREVLLAQAPATPFQGYAGPGWSGVALVAADLAFPEAAHAASAPASALAAVLDTRDIFDEALREIPARAEAIQQVLARSVWNGKLRLARDDRTSAAGGLATALLREVGATAERVRGVFDSAIGRLQGATLDAHLAQALVHARLAIEVVDRNLYERANDCRWWALDDTLRDAAAGGPRRGDAPAVLARLNDLYSVYAGLVLFDAGGTVVAVSRPGMSGLVGSAVPADLLASVRALGDGDEWHVSRHRPTPLSGGVPALVYAAAIAGGGGVALVFDGATQFPALLRDCLPPGAKGVGLLVDRDGTVVASTDPRYPAGSAGPVPAAALASAPGTALVDTVTLDGTVHALGVAHAAGYREYRADGRARPDDLVAAVLTPLGRERASPGDVADEQAAFRLRAPDARDAARTHPSHAAPGDTLAIATWRRGGAWYGLPADTVEAGLGPVRVLPVPNARAPVRGMVAWGDAMVAVWDLAPEPASAAAAPGEPGARAGDGHPGRGGFVVCRLAGDRTVALQVDALGDVLSVPRDALRPWSPPGADRPVHLLPGEAGLLTVLDPEALRSGAPEPGVLPAPGVGAGGLSAGPEGRASEDDGAAGGVAKAPEPWVTGDGPGAPASRD